MFDKELVQDTVAGLPSAAEMNNGTDTDNLQADIVDPETGESQGASLRKGEYVIDVPSIFGLGEGDYEKGLETLKGIHEHLREKGLAFMEKQGLGAEIAGDTE